MAMFIRKIRALEFFFKSPLWQKARDDTVYNICFMCRYMCVLSIFFRILLCKMSGKKGNTAI